MIERVTTFLQKYKYSTATLLLGAAYYSLLVRSFDITAGDYKGFTHEPFHVSYGIERWFHWSSRILIESAVNLFSKNLFAWEIVTVLLGAILFWSLGRIVGNRLLRQSVVLFSILLLTNLYMLTTAGIFATTINYMWPVACFAFVVAVTLRPLRAGWLRTASRVISIIFYLFAMCSEQLALLAVLLGAAYIGYLLYVKVRVPVMVWVLFAIAILGVINIFLSPGNGLRTSVDINELWPQFSGMSITHKATIGILATFSRLLLAPEIPALLLIFGLLFLSYKKVNIKAFVSILPTAVLTILFFFPYVADNPATNIRAPSFFSQMQSEAIHFTPDNLPHGDREHVYLLLFLGIVVSIIMSILYLYGMTKKTYVILTSLVAGVLVSLAVSVSPTLFASNTRTLYPLVTILILIDFIIIQELIDLQFRPLYTKSRAGKMIK